MGYRKATNNQSNNTNNYKKNYKGKNALKYDEHEPFLIDPDLSPLEMVRQYIADRVPFGTIDDAFILDVFITLQVTQEEIEAIAAYEQRSDEWHAARKGCVKPELNHYQPPRMSSSTVGEALDHKAPDFHTREPSKLVCLRNFVWPEEKPPMDAQGKINCDKGTATEPWFMSLLETCCQNIAQMEDPDNEVIAVEHGFRIHDQEFWLGVSADIIFWTINTRTGIITCRGGEMKAKAKPGTKPYPHIKHDYYDQIQSTMFVLNREFGITDYVFGCYTPEAFSFEIYDYNKAYWEKQMQVLKVFYFSDVIPRFILRWKGILPRPMLDLPIKDLTSVTSGMIENQHPGEDPIEDVTDEEMSLVKPNIPSVNMMNRDAFSRPKRPPPPNNVVDVQHDYSVSNFKLSHGQEELSHTDHQMMSQTNVETYHHTTTSHDAYGSESLASPVVQNQITPSNASKLSLASFQFEDDY
jgi:hypothetical protein